MGARAYTQIGSVFASLSGEAEAVLPDRFLHLKRCVSAALAYLSGAGGAEGEESRTGC